MRALCHLAQRYGEGLVHIKTVAADEEIPPKFLEGILLELKRAGYLASRRGVDGGYELAKSPDEIHLGDVIRVLDGPLAPMASASELQALMDRNPRQIGFYAVLMDVRNAVSDILDQTSLAEVLRRNLTMQHIAIEAASPPEDGDED
jgi:Rrf2 family protein